MVLEDHAIHPGTAMEMAKRLHERSKAERNPEAAKKQAAMASVFRQLAERALSRCVKGSGIAYPRTTSGN
jgi:hypothetical protein